MKTGATCDAIKTSRSGSNCESVDGPFDTPPNVQGFPVCWPEKMYVCLTPWERLPHSLEGLVNVPHLLDKSGLNTSFLGKRTWKFVPQKPLCGATAAQVGPQKRVGVCLLRGNQTDKQQGTRENLPVSPHFADIC